MSLPPRPALLAGREELLAELDALLTDEERPQTVVLCGLGGVGKTSLAAEYAHRHLGELGVAWQVAAEDPAVLAAEMSELAAQVGGRPLADPRDPVASAHATLAAYPTSWLLIFDNAPDEASVRRFLPPAGRGRVLVTSQSQHWHDGRKLDVPVLDEETAAQFLVSRTGDADQAAARELARELGGLPLALEQAVGDVRATAITLARYLSLFRERKAALLDRGEAVGHLQAVEATLALALARLDAEAPSAAGLLRLLACLAAEPVPLSLLLSGAEGAGDLDPTVAQVIAPLLGDPLAAGDAIAALRRYSLVSPAGDGLVLVHRLVQAVTINQMTPDLAASWRQAAAALINAAIPDDTSLPATWPVCAVLLPHAQAVLDLSSDGMWNIASYLGHSGSHLAAAAVWQQIADARQQADGVEHPATLAAWANFALWSAEAGDPVRAREVYVTLLPIEERVLGTDHLDTLRLRANLGYLMGKAGDAPGARDLYAALLPVRERVQGSEHPDTLITRSNLARWAGEAGDAAGARDQYAALLPVRERVLGAEHPDTLAARANLARWIGEAGDPARARDLYAALLPVEERILGPEHPVTLSTRANLAAWTGYAGDPVGARDQYAALLPVEERVSGVEHPDTLITRSTLARWAGEAGDAAGARDQYAALLPVRERVLGAEHPDTLAARANLARWTGEAGDPARARDLYAELLRVLSPEHPDTLAIRSNLVRWEREASRNAR